MWWCRVSKSQCEAPGCPIMGNRQTKVTLKQLWDPQAVEACSRSGASAPEAGTPRWRCGGGACSRSDPPAAGGWDPRWRCQRGGGRGWRQEKGGGEEAHIKSRTFTRGEEKGAPVGFWEASSRGAPDRQPEQKLKFVVWKYGLNTLEYLYKRSYCC